MGVTTRGNVGDVSPRFGILVDVPPENVVFEEFLLKVLDFLIYPK